ncbi:Clp protease ClpP, partial [Enterococcus faecalis]|uniref:Clp protease ClpP n=2 Tax=Enterococcus TaxID=1350 RepID=UPI00313C6F31
MTVKIKVNGPIISNDDKWFYELFDMESTSPNDVLDLLPANNEDVEVTINSNGGLVDMGNEIYTALRSYEGHVKVNIVMAGSAASIIAMAGNKVAISPVGQIMIHNVAMGAGGDYHTMDKASEILQKANKSLANAYVSKTGKAKEEILA